MKKIKLLVNRIQHILIDKIIIRNNLEKLIVNPFHILYALSSKKTFRTTYWLGKNVIKVPLDLWIYQEIIFQHKPDIIIECGTQLGGTALYLANICDLINNGRIITIDLEDKRGKPQHKRITYIIGSSTSEKVVNQIKSLINDNDKVMVILDSDHHKNHVFNELTIYSKLVTKENYIIVEDTNLNGHPTNPEHGDGPMEAVFDFLKVYNNFVIDKSMEKFFMTFNPNGYLKRIE